MARDRVIPATRISPEAWQKGERDRKITGYSWGQYIDAAILNVEVVREPSIVGKPITPAVKPVHAPTTPAAEPTDVQRN